MKKWSAHMLTGMKTMTKMRAGDTCRPDANGPACRRGEARSSMRVARFAVVAVMAMVFGMAGFVSSADAAVSQLDAWPNTPQATATGTTANTTWTISNGTNRLMVAIVAISEGTDRAHTASTITYGGVTMNPASVTSSNRRDILTFYLDESEIVGRSGDAFTVTVANSANTSVYLASYEGVDQGNPINATYQAYNANTAPTINFGTGLAVADGGAAVFGVASNSTATTTVTESYNMTTRYTNGTNNQVGYREFVTGTTTNPTVNYGANVRVAIGALTINPLSCVPTGNLSVTAGQNLAGDPVDLTSISNASNAANIVYTVSDGVPGAPTTLFEDFGTGNGGMDAGTFTGTWIPVDTVDTTANEWHTDSDATASGQPDVGPTVDQSGTGYYIHTEASASAGPLFVMESIPLDNVNNAVSLDYYFNKRHAGITSCSLYVDVSSDAGTTWDNLAVTGPGFAESSGDQTVWDNDSVDLSGITPTGGQDNIKIRFRAESTAGDYQCDTALDTITITSTPRSTTYFTGNAAQAASVDTSAWPSPSTLTLTIDGDDATCGTPLTQAQDTFDFTACTETASVALDAVTDPITGSVTISATLGGSGGSNVEVSDDNVTWHASPWSYNPPASAEGSVTFYAQATGTCGTVADATPTTVNYDTLAPSVSTTVPADAATGIAKDSDVTINFSENIDCATVDTSSVTIVPAVTNWTRTSCSGNTAVFSMDADSQTNSTEYTVTVNSSVSDLVGFNMTGDATFSYTTDCTDSIASSIAFNGVTTAAGDFAGLSMVTPVDLTNLEYRITETTGGGSTTVSRVNWSAGVIDNATHSYTVGAGTDRVLIVVVTNEDANLAEVTGVTYGGQTVTEIDQVTQGVGYSNINWVGYCDEACIAAAGNTNIVASWGADGMTNSIIFAATYQGVNQTTPVNDFASVASGNDTVSVQVNNVEGGMVIYSAEFNGNGDTSINPPGGFTSRGVLDTGGTGFRAGIGDRNTTTAGTVTVNPTNGGAASNRSTLVAIALNPASTGPVETEVLAWNADPQEANGLLTNGNTYTLYARGVDAECGINVSYVGGGAEPGTGQDFTWSSCNEDKTLNLTAITDPITGDVSVTATGTAAGISVGTTPAAGNASGWTYSPAQDDNTTTVNFYATGTGTCGAMYDSQLNVATNTMAAPIITGFVAADTIDTSAAPYDINITTFTATDNVAVTGYQITESASAPAAGDPNWLGMAPTTYEVPAYGDYTLYAWTKDAAGNVSSTVSSTANISNCTEVGTVSVSISPDPGAGDITGNVTVSATPANGASNGMVRSRVDGGPWSSWVASGANFTPPVKSSGTVEFEAMADGSCGAASPVYSSTLSRTFETRIAPLEPVDASALQNGLTKIRAIMIYCNDLNHSGRFKVEYKLATDGTYTVVYDGITGAIDGGVGDVDGTWNDEVLIDIDLGATPTYGLYDVRMTFVDGTDGLTGAQPAEWNVQVDLIEWTDNAMLHNSNRFPGTTKHSGDWGTDTGAKGPIVCATCHDKNTGNVKKVKASISFPDGSTMPGGGTSATVDLQTVEDGSSDFGDDSAAPRASSNRVCEVCHTYDAAQLVGVQQHAADQAVAANHYDNSDCIKCHQHKVGFKADCTSCHASPPVNAGGLDVSVGTGSLTAGKHLQHAATGGLEYGCNTCHTGWENSGQMPNGGAINLGFNIVLGSTTDTTGTYDGRSAGTYTTAAGTTNSAGDALTCSAIYCHGTASPVWNDAGTAVCGSCHGDATGAPTTTAGDGDLSGAISGTKVGKHPQHVARGYACTICHNTAGDGSQHVDGDNQVIFSGAAVGTNYNYGTSTCSAVACHSGSYVWDTASAALNCDSCHGYPPTSAADAANNKHVAPTPVNHDKFVAGDTSNITGPHGECNTCHGFSSANGATDNTTNGGDAYLDYHQDGVIDMNGITAPDDGQNTDYNQANWGCNAACHSPSNDAAHQLSDSGFAVRMGEYGAGSCEGCHNGTGNPGDATLVDVDSPHSTTSTGYTCEECHTAHEAGDVIIPNNANTNIGINYTGNGETGISLSDPVSATPKTTEAEICWACHAAEGVDGEFGLNQKANTGNISYNYGTLDGTNGNVNWVGAAWSSGIAKFGFKDGAIQSTHAATSAGRAGVDLVGNIRCSYCHDVHDLNRATGDNLSGTPYLRGTWFGNPYREDGPPQTGDSWTTNIFGAVPRGTTASTQLGGFQIDQNNGNPTSTWSATGSSGLCELCHGNGNATWTAAEISSIDLNSHGNATDGSSPAFTTNNWVGTNGHSNSVIDGGGSAASNIFRIADRNTSPPSFINDDSDVNSSGGNPAMAYQQVSASGTGNRGFGFRSSTAEPDGWNLNPRTTNRYAHDSYNWGADTNNATDIGYHQFSCSKCHNPHASRLPRLMITNCLDTKQNTWDNGQTTIPNGTQNVDRSSTVSADNSNVKFSQATSAQNCHRVKDPAFSQSRGAGWNTVTPWGTSR